MQADADERMQAALEAHVGPDVVPGLAWGIEAGGEVHVGAAGVVDVVDRTPVRADTIFRISSMTKPVTAVAALLLVEEGRLRLDDAVDDLLPELGDRRVLAAPAGSIDDTVPADRPITVRDVLTFRLGYGMDFAAPFPQPLLEAMAEVGLGAGPPAPATLPAPDEWLARLGTLPLSHQPGTRWLYHTGAEVLGVLVARAAGAPFPDVLRDRIFTPLGMADTAFAVPPSSLERFGPCYGPDPAEPYDPTDGQWSAPPAFASGGDGLVSTVGDYLAFARMLLGGGAPLLSPATVEAMTTNQLGDVRSSGPSPTGAAGWGLGVGVQLRDEPGRPAGSYGWDGGLGSSWANDPATGLAGVLLTNQMWTSPEPPPVCRDFWTTAHDLARS